jgi:molybdate transport system substrate-binding protein
VKRLTGLASALLLLALAGCGSGSDGSSAKTQHATLTVFAASSLTQTFTEIGKQFEAQHHGVTVRFSFGGSSDLVAQIQQGAPADVFASADTANMDKLTADHLERGTPKDFATNTLEIATPPDNPAGIATFQDLAKKGVKLVMCAAEVPCGAAAHKAESAAGVHLKPVSEEQSVTDVLSKVTSGEADAGLVYVTDVEGAGSKVKGVTFPEASSAVNTYPIATVAKSKHATLAAQFVSMVTGAKGQAVLRHAGFAKP